MNSDLRESGSLEQDADIIHHLYRDEMYDPNSQYVGISEIITGKFRGGEVGTDYVDWQGRYSRFRNLDYNNLPSQENTYQQKGF
jgi:replicative DNA helicase